MSEKDSSFFRRLRKFTFVAAILVLLIVYNIYIQITSPIQPSFKENQQLFVQIQINIVLISILAALLVRTWIKLVYEKKRKVPGFKLKRKLIFAFLFLASTPLLLFFYVTNDYLTSKIDQWFLPQTNLTIDKTITVLQDLKQKQRKTLNEVAPQLAQRLKNVDPQDNFDQFLGAFESRQPLNGVVVYDGKGQVLGHHEILKLTTDIWRPADSFLFGNMKKNLFTFTSDEGLIRSFVRFNNNISRQNYYLEVYLDEKVLSSSDTFKTLDDLAALQKSIKANQVLALNHEILLVWIAVLMIFAFSWFAIYISRSVVDPVEKLLYGMQKVTEGDWQVRLPTDLGRADELKQALHTFNKMVAELHNKSKLISENQIQLSKTNESLNQKNQILQNIFKSMQVGSATITDAGNFLEANQSFWKLFDVSPLNLKNSKVHYRQVLPPETVRFITSLNEKLSDTDAAYVQKDFKHYYNQGEAYYKFEIYKIQNDANQEICRLILIYDLTEIDKLMHARAWQDVARRIAHEIKNPLTPIRISAERIQQRYYKQDPKKYQALFDITNTIITEVDIIKKMVNEFAEFARMPLIQLRSSSVNQVVKNIASTYRHNMPGNITLQVKQSVDDVKTMIDEKQLQQALHNLVQNAVNSLRGMAGGKIILATELDKKLGMVRIVVEDNGPGIASNIIGSVFEPYVTTDKQGTGLGLAITQKIIHDHQGAIKVRSNPSQHKTTFTIELPVVA